jgi:hypothetical protein
MRKSNSRRRKATTQSEVTDETDEEKEKEREQRSRMYSRREGKGEGAEKSNAFHRKPVPKSPFSGK